MFFKKAFHYVSVVFLAGINFANSIIRRTKKLLGVYLCYLSIFNIKKYLQLSYRIYLNRNRIFNNAKTHIKWLTFSKIDN